MPTSHERVSHALSLLTAGLVPYVENTLQAVYKNRWQNAARESFRGGRGQGLGDGEELSWDAHTVLTVMWDQWNSLFRHKLQQTHRSLVSELRDFRNRWAHQEAFNFDDTYRILDSAERLLRAIDAPEADAIHFEKRSTMQDYFSQQLEQAADEAGRKKRKIQDIVVYVCCGGVLIVAFAALLDKTNWYVPGFVAAATAFLIYRRTRTEIPKFGPHECERCRRIIYTATCPYCTMAVTVSHSDELFDDSENDDDTSSSS